MKIALLAVLLVSCGCAGVDVTKPVSQAPHLAALLRDPKGCKTDCGMTVPQGGDCADLEAYEREIVKGLGAAQRDYTEAKICSGVKGYTIAIRERRPIDSLCDKPDGGHDGWVAFFTPNGYFCARGITDIESKTITIEHNDWRHSVLAHEIVHAVEARPGHCRWGSFPLRVAVSELMGEPDESVPERSRCDEDGGYLPEPDGGTP